MRLLKPCGCSQLCCAAVCAHLGAGQLLGGLSCSGQAWA